MKMVKKAKTPSREDTISQQRERRKISCRHWERKSSKWCEVESPRDFKKQQMCISQESSPGCRAAQLCHVYCMYRFLIIQHIFYVMALKKEMPSHSYSPKASAFEDEMSDCRCITCSATIKSSTIGERWSPWKQALFEKLMQWGMSTLICTDLAQPKSFQDKE